MEKLLSVCIPMYNAEKTIEECLLSCIDERYKDYLDVIIVNNSSNDGSIKIAHEYQNKFPNTIRVFMRDTKDIGGAYNIAIKNSNGKFFMILDADDLLDNDGLNDLINKLKVTGDVDLVVFDRKNFELNNQIVKQTGVPENLICDFDEWCSKIQIFIHQICFSTKLLKNYKIKADENYIQFADNVFAWKAFCNTQKFIYIPVIAYKYRITELQSLSINGIRKYYLDGVKVAVSMNSLYEECKAAGVLSKAKQSLFYNSLKTVFYGAYHRLLFVNIAERKTNVKLLNSQIDDIKLWKDMPIYTRLIRDNVIILHPILKACFFIIKKINVR